METLAIEINKILLKDVCSYLYDAGFLNNLYEIKNFGNYVEVFFKCNKAVDYVLKDVRTSDFKYLEVKKYHHYDGICSAIITYA